MLSYKESNHPQGLHKRQNSTPAVFEARKATLLPATHQPNGHHRRGNSVDQTKSPQISHQSFGHDDQSVSMKHGLQPPQQHHLRESQQHPAMARPGQLHPINEAYQQQSSGRYQPASIQEFGPGYITNTIFSNPFQETNSSNVHEILDGQKNTNMEITQPFDTTNSAGYLEGLRYGLDENTGVTPRNEEWAMYANSPNPDEGVMADQKKMQRQERPCTPQNQINQGKSISRGVESH